VDIVVNVCSSIEPATSGSAEVASNDYPLATLGRRRSGLPVRSPTTPTAVQLHGDLTVKTTTAPVVLDATARRESGELQIKATTQVKLSTFDAGPIRLVGFVSTGDDVTLDIDLVASDPAKLGSQSNLAWQQSESQSGGGEGPSFKKVVQPILQNNCAACRAR
jgi:hypothetical protein